MIVRVVAIVGGLCVSTAAAQVGTLLYRQSPNRLFGFTADTMFIDDAGNPNGELIADKFVLGQGASVCNVRFWGFYGSSVNPTSEPPPIDETFSLRFYSDTAGLPVDVLHASVVANPSRVATGFSIATGSGPPEYLYDVTLPGCFTAQPGTPYWIEVAQVGDLASRFRWETASGGEFASQFPIGNPWLVNSGGQMAYELRTPEPASGALVGIGILYLLRRDKR